MWKEENQSCSAFLLIPIGSITVVILAAILFPYLVRARVNARIANAEYALHARGAIIRAYAKKHGGEYPSPKVAQNLWKKDKNSQIQSDIADYKYNCPPKNASGGHTVIRCRVHAMGRSGPYIYLDLHLNDTVKRH